MSSIRAVIFLTILACGSCAPRGTHSRTPIRDLADDSGDKGAYFGPFSSVANTHFSIYRFFGNDLGHELFTSRAVQTGPHTYDFHLRSVDHGQKTITRAELLAKHRAVTQRMLLKGPHPLAPAMKDSLDRIDELVESERTVHFEFNRDGEVVTSLSLVAGEMPTLRGPEHEVLEYEARALPWMYGENGTILIQRRPDHGKLIYELSRGSNTEDPELFRYTFAVAVMEAARDAIQKGVSLEEAYIYGHTVKAETTQHFTEHFPWKRWTRYDDQFPKDHALFRSSIAELLRTPFPALYEGEPPVRIHEYEHSFKAEADALTNGDPVKLFAFKADTAARDFDYFRLTYADGSSPELARVTFPRELRELRMLVACARHGIDHATAMRRLGTREDPGEDFHTYFDRWNPARGGTVIVELAPPARLHPGRYTTIAHPLELHAVDLSAVRTRIRMEYATLLKEWLRFGHTTAELGYDTPRNLLREVNRLNTRIYVQRGTDNAQGRQETREEVHEGRLRRAIHGTNAKVRVRELRRSQRSRR